MRRASPLGVAIDSSLIRWKFPTFFEYSPRMFWLSFPLRKNWRLVVVLQSLIQKGGANPRWFDYHQIPRIWPLLVAVFQCSRGLSCCVHVDVCWDRGQLSRSFKLSLKLAGFAVISSVDNAIDPHADLRKETMATKRMPKIRSMNFFWCFGPCVWALSCVIVSDFTKWFDECHCYALLRKSLSVADKLAGFAFPSPSLISAPHLTA